MVQTSFTGGFAIRTSVGNTVDHGVSLLLCFHGASAREKKQFVQLCLRLFPVGSKESVVLPP